MIARISRDDLRAMIDRADSFVLLEALPATYFEDAHLPGAQNMPHDQIDALAATLIPDRATPVVVYCASLPCPTSEIAARRLSALGYTDVREYAEGKEDWVNAGLPVERGAAAARR